MLNLTALILLAVACLAGCSTVEVQHTGKSSEEIEPDETLTLLLDYVGGSPEDAAKLEARLGECLQEALHKACKTSKLIPSDEFRRLVFPGSDITSAPRSGESLTLLLKAPEFRQKIDSLWLRYLISIKEATWSKQELGGVVGGGYGAPGFIIGSAQEKRTTLTAHIIDVKTGSEIDVVDIRAESTGFYGCVVILPIVVPPRTESPACQRFGSEVVKSISYRQE